MWTRAGQGNHALDGDPNLLRIRHFEGGKVAPTVTYTGMSAVSPAQTAEPIVMPFGKLSGVGPGNHVLDGGHIGATWRMRLNRACAAAMGLYVILL